MSDVCLILEGTYPFVSGGVSTWIHQLISSMGDLRFSIVYISPYPNPRREYKYRLPPNVVDLQDLYLHDYKAGAERSTPAQRARAVERLTAAHEGIFAGRWEALGEALTVLRDPKHAPTFYDLFQSPESWDAMESFYRRYGKDCSFLDFFWTWRAVYLPLIRTLQCPIPPARLYHTVSTGYAGALACVAKRTQDCGMILTEHGVYTHERLLEISQSTWIYTPRRERFRVSRELSFFKRFWLGFFDLMGRLTYHHADRIITLFEGNRVKQVATGAPSDKITIIPNGIPVEEYREITLRPAPGGRRTVAFIGRVVPIKDVKTFVHAARIIAESFPEVDFEVLGPLDEEPEYARECRELARTLGLQDRLRFPGKVDMKERYPAIDLVVLTSLSEAQPYVILEANAVGIPVVATDVGACREMLQGAGEADRALGPSGLLTPVSHPDATAAAVARLLRDRDLWARMSEAGRQRTLRFYDQNDLISKYLNMYEHMMR